MYVGHVGIALGLRRAAGAPPLWLLMLAAQGPDWGDALFEAAKIRPADPGWLPHGWPLMALGIVLAAALGAHLTRGWRGAALAGGAYLSHWLVDYVTGFKPTWPGGPTVGLGWYGHPGRDLLLESAVALVGWVLWRTSLPAPPAEVLARARPRRHAGLDWALLGALLALQLAANVAMARSLGLG